MYKLFPLLIVLAALLTGCGDSDPPTAATPTPTPSTQSHEEAELAGYSEGVKNYYGGGHTDESEAVDPTEGEYHQPPKPAEAGVNGTITLTGTNIGVRFDVTVTKVERVSERYVGVFVDMKSTGITIFQGPFSGEVTYPGGKLEALDLEGEAECAEWLDELYIDVGDSASGCLLFPASGSDLPERVQLALETVPANAGGIWNL
jgi:hypothetical protein